MDRFFNMDNKFFVFMSKVADLFILNILCLICCLPVVTAGASITALYYVSMKMVRNEESYIFKSFFKSFRQNFKQATIIHLIFLAAGIILYFDIRIVQAMGGMISSIFTVVFSAFFILYVLVLLYIYPLLAKFYNTTKNIIKNAFLMSVRHLPYTFLMAVITASPLLVLLIPNARIQYSILLLFLMFGFSTIAYCHSVFFLKIFDGYMPREEASETAISENGDKAS